VTDPDSNFILQSKDIEAKAIYYISIRVVQSSQLLGNYIPTYRLLICVLLSNQQ
jgi:hypothetical protein